MIFSSYLLTKPDPSSSQDYPETIQKSQTCGHKAMTWWSEILKSVVTDAYDQVLCMTPFLEQSEQYPMRQTIFSVILGPYLAMAAYYWNPSSSQDHPENHPKWTKNGHRAMTWWYENLKTDTVDAHQKVGHAFYHFLSDPSNISWVSSISFFILKKKQNFPKSQDRGCTYIITWTCT